MIDLPIAAVEKKLSQMILDNQFLGILDQGAGNLILFEEPVTDTTYPNALKTMESMGQVVDSLYQRASKLQ